MYGELNLATEGNGKGTIYNFKHFNQALDIPFGDLKDIVRYIPIDLDNKKAAHDIVEKIQGKIELLKHNPKNY